MYPYPLLNSNLKIAPVLGQEYNQNPAEFDFSYQNEQLWNIDVDDQKFFQKMVEEGLKTQEGIWGLAGYLERRDSLLKNLPQMVQENRFFHLGVDIIAPFGTPVHAPLDGEVVESAYEAGKGNFGGYTLLRHKVDELEFYSLYGHLDPATLLLKGTRVKASQQIAKMGDYSVNGDWFAHTHLQVLTPKGLEKGFISKGYCAPELLGEIQYLCPSPLFLLKY